MTLPALGGGEAARASAQARHRGGRLIFRKHLQDIMPPMSDPHEHPGREPLWQRLRGGVLAVLKWSPDIPARTLKRVWAVLVPVNVALAVLVYLGFTHEGWRAFAREAVVDVTSFWMILTVQASRRRRSRRTSETAEVGATDWFNPSRKPWF